MIPGPNYVYECPSCKNFLTNGSIISGNTFGSSFYSDGKRYSIMMPDFPDLTKCKKCETIFWLSNLEPIGTVEWDRENKKEWEQADKATSLTIEDNFKAINDGLAENNNDELLIRRAIFWLYNDRIRNKLPLFNDEQDEERWTANCKRLLSLLDESDLNQKIMMAELYRNLGDFEACIAIFENIDNDQISWLKEIIFNQCEQKNRWVVKLN